MLPQNFLKQLLDATMQVLLALLKIILLPFNLWVKSIGNLAEQREKGLLDLNKITGPWPFFTFCKRLFIDVILDVVSFLSYPVGVLVAFVAFIVVLVDDADFFEAIAAFTGSLVIAYFVPVYTALLNNLFKLMLLPLGKLVDWLKKPAQQLDINAVQNVKVKKEE